MTFFSYDEALFSGLQIKKTETLMLPTDVIDLILNYCPKEEFHLLRLVNRALNQQIFFYSVQMFDVSAFENTLDSIVPLTALRLVSFFKKALSRLHSTNPAFSEYEQISFAPSLEVVFKRKNADYYLSNKKELLDVTLWHYKERAKEENVTLNYLEGSRMHDYQKQLFIVLCVITLALPTVSIALAVKLSGNPTVIAAVTVPAVIGFILACAALILFGLSLYRFSTSDFWDGRCLDLASCICMIPFFTPCKYQSAHTDLVEKRLEKIRSRKSLLGFSENITHTAQLFRRTATPSLLIDSLINVTSSTNTGNELPELREQTQNNLEFFV